MNEEFEIGLESNRLTFNRFYTNFSTRRATQAPNKITKWGDLKLPVGSVLHTVNGFETLTAPNEGLPNTDLPLLKNETSTIFLKMNVYPSDEHSKPFGVDETYSYRPSRISSAISGFYTHHRKFHRVLSDRTIGRMTNVLNWIDYSPLCEMKVSGLLHAYRKFDIIARTILNTIDKIGEESHHFILVPQLNHVYSKTVLQKAFSDLSTSTLNTFSHDPSIFFVLHILGYVYSQNRDLDVTPYKEDVRLAGGDNEELSHLKSTSLIDRLDPKLFPAINFIFQRGDKAVVYNLDDIRKFSEKPTFYTALYRHIMNLRLSEAEVPATVDKDSTEFDTLVEGISDKTSEEREFVSNTQNNEEIVVPVKEKTKIKLSGTIDKKPVVPNNDTISTIVVPVSSNTGFEKTIRAESENFVKVTTDEDSVKLTKHEDLIENHFSAQIAGLPLKAHLSQTVSPEVTSHDLSFIDSAPEESYKKSTLLAIDKVYDKHFYKKDLAKVLASTAKHGYYITNIDELFNNSEMDRTVSYKVSLTDVNGRSHTIKFTLPHIDDDGNVKLSGVNYRLIRQANNLPICKISANRVNVSSYYNKFIVGLVQSKRYSFETFMYRLILDLKQQDIINATLGKSPVFNYRVPYDFSVIGSKFIQISFGSYDLNFSNDRGPVLVENKDAEKEIDKLSKQYGIYCGYSSKNSFLFWDMSNTIHEIKDGKHIASWKSFRNMVYDITKSEEILTPVVSEWTQVQIINQVIPIVFVLGYQFGLKKLFEMINLDYVFYEKGTEFQTEMDDIVIEFEDGHLVFNRYPIQRSLVAAGLSWVSLKQFSFREMSLPQTYVKILALKKMTVGVLKGIRGFIDFFVDPVTEEILEEMGEPTTFSGLLLRANIMLSDHYSVEPSSVSMQRFRLYERFNGMIYNEIYRSLANHRNNTASKKNFSINPEAVYQSIIQDATMSINDTINPVHEVKQKSNFTYTGAGGRDGDSFVLRDRVYPKDGVGIISDAVPDSGKVGITAYLSASPRIDNVRGVPIPYKDGDTLEPPQILSIGSMVMPGGTTDDGKRNSYLSIQISHYVPNHSEGETLSVRTGYDEVLPHLCSDIFAISADQNGTVEAIDPKMKVVTIKYDDKLIVPKTSLRIPYTDQIIDKKKNERSYISILIPDTKLNEYPIGEIFSLNRSSNGKVIDRLICSKVEDIPDKEVANKYNDLAKDLVNRKYKSLYFVRLEVIGKYEPGDIKTYSYKDIYSPISGSHLLQKREINVSVGENVKRGDILVYNSGFFVPSPFSKQVTFKHGVTGTIALSERSTNHEDACEITRDFSKRLDMTPCHKREIVTKKDAAIVSIVDIGDFVETTDPLCIISDEYLVQTHGVLTSENLDIMAKLNRQTPAADYNGRIREIRFLYACPRDELSDSLKKILTVYEKKVRQEHKALGQSEIEMIDRPGYVKSGTKYLGIDFSEDTVIIEFMIEEVLGMEAGDKLVVGNANKSIVSYVSEEPHYTEDGQPVDMLFSTTSVVNRIVKSPLSIGMSEQIMEELKRQVVSKYFE